MQDIVEQIVLVLVCAYTLKKHSLHISQWNCIEVLAILSYCEPLFLIINNELEICLFMNMGVYALIKLIKL